MVICHIGHLAVLVETPFCQGFPKGFGSPRLVRFRGVHDALAWKDLMAEVDLTILSIAQAGGAKGMGQGMVLTELVTQLHHLAESAQQQTERRQIQLESAESAAELRQEELETQNLRLEAELAKTQMIQSTLQDRGRKGLAQRKNTWESWEMAGNVIGMSLECHWNVIEMSLKCHWNVIGDQLGFNSWDTSLWMAGRKDSKPLALPDDLPEATEDTDHSDQRWSETCRDTGWDMRRMRLQLVGGLEYFLFSHMLGIIIPTDYFCPVGWNHQPDEITICTLRQCQEYSAIIKEVVLNGWDSVEWAKPSGLTATSSSGCWMILIELWTQYPEASMHHTTKGWGKFLASLRVGISLCCIGGGPWRTDVFSCLRTLTAGVNWGLPCKTVSIFANPYWSWNPRAASGCCICYRGKGIGPNKLLMKSDIAAGWELIPPCETTREWPVWVSSGGGSCFFFFFGSMFHPNSISTWDDYPIRLSYMIKLVCPSMVILRHIYIYIYIFIYLVGGLEHVWFSIYGMSSFPLTNSIIFQRGR